ncbi:MAG: DUF3606 domain-containing protein [Parvibaculaceae bacterium]
MADNKKARGKADRSKVSKSEAYEVAYFARKHGISAAQARALIDKVGNSRTKLAAAAKKLKGAGSKKAARKTSKKAARKTGRTAARKTGRTAAKKTGRTAAKKTGRTAARKKAGKR